MGWGSIRDSLYQSVTGGGGGSSQNSNQNSTNVDASNYNEINIDMDEVARAQQNTATATDNVATANFDIAKSQYLGNDIAKDSNNITQNYYDQDIALRQEDLLFQSFTFEEQQDLADKELQIKIAEYNSNLAKEKREALQALEEKKQNEKNRKLMTFIGISALIVGILSYLKKGKK